MRIALDTNVLVAAFATRGLSSDLVNLVLAEHQLILGETVVAELERILRTKIKVPADTVDETIRFLRGQSVVVSQGADIDLELRDPDDVPVVAEAVAGLAEILVSGDKDLLDAVDPPLRIVNPRTLWEILRGGPA